MEKNIENNEIDQETAEKIENETTEKIEEGIDPVIEELVEEHKKSRAKVLGRFNSNLWLRLFLGIAACCPKILKHLDYLSYKASNPTADKVINGSLFLGIVLLVSCACILELALIILEGSLFWLFAKVDNSLGNHNRNWFLKLLGNAIKYTALPLAFLLSSMDALANITLAKLGNAVGAIAAPLVSFGTKIGILKTPK
ncbi:MAG: hypothetical protein LBP39_00475, partial [Rickettsiales bacterium]|nr:hypothetical protein [Rickettsiales bacterium]